MGFLEALTILFIILKLVGVVSWSWLVVFSPILIAIAFYILVWLLVALGVFKSASALFWWRK